MNIVSSLNELANYQAQVTVLHLEKQRLLDEAMPQEIKQRLAEIELEFAGKTESAQEKIDTLTAEIKQAVIHEGASVKGDFLHAVYSKGRVTWDGKQLEGMMALIPGLAAARKEGEPSVSFRSIK